MSLPKMRTAQQLVNEYKASDPNTSINTHFIRVLINSGKISFVESGRKKMINADEFADYLHKGKKHFEEADDKYGKIRPIKEKR